MKKKILPILMLVLGMFNVSNLLAADDLEKKSGGNVIKESVKVNSCYLNGPSSIPSAYMMEQIKRTQKNDDDIQFYFEKFADPQSMVPKLLKKEVDIGFLPVNVAAKIYNTSKKSIVCLAVTGNTNLVLITKDKSIKEIADLSEKTVYVAGQGATPEYLFRWILAQNNISNITLDYSIPPANLPAQLISDKIEYAVVPEPFATIALSKSNSVFYALDLQKEYERITEGGRSIPFTVVVARKDFVEENPDAVNMYLDLLEKSLDWTKKNPLSAGKYCEKFEMGLTATIAANSIPKSNYIFLSAEEGKEKIEELLRIFMEFERSSIGGKLPDSNFYYKKTVKTME